MGTCILEYIFKSNYLHRRGPQKKNFSGGQNSELFYMLFPWEGEKMTRAGNSGTKFLFTYLIIWQIVWATAFRFGFILKLMELL